MLQNYLCSRATFLKDLEVPNGHWGRCGCRAQCCMVWLGEHSPWLSFSCSPFTHPSSSSLCSRVIQPRDAPGKQHSQDHHPPSFLPAPFWCCLAVGASTRWVPAVLAAALIPRDDANILSFISLCLIDAASRCHPCHQLHERSCSQQLSSLHPSPACGRADPSSQGLGDLAKCP